MQALARQVPVAGFVQEYAARLVLATHPGSSRDSSRPLDVARRFVRYGASPRGLQALIRAGKVRALAQGRLNVAVEDVQALALPALRHRIILNFEGEAQGMDPDDVLQSAIQSTDAREAPAAGP